MKKSFKKIFALCCMISGLYGSSVDAVKTPYFVHVANITITLDTDYLKACGNLGNHNSKASAFLYLNTLQPKKRFFAILATKPLRTAKRIYEECKINPTNVSLLRNKSNLQYFIVPDVKKYKAEWASHQTVPEGEGEVAPQKVEHTGSVDYIPVFFADVITYNEEDDKDYTLENSCYTQSGPSTTASPNYLNFSQTPTREATNTTWFGNSSTFNLSGSAHIGSSIVHNITYTPSSVTAASVSPAVLPSPVLSYSSMSSLPPAPSTCSHSSILALAAAASSSESSLTSSSTYSPLSSSPQVSHVPTAPLSLPIPPPPPFPASLTTRVFSPLPPLPAFPTIGAPSAFSSFPDLQLPPFPYMPAEMNHVSMFCSHVVPNYVSQTSVEASTPSAVPLSLFPSEPVITLNSSSINNGTVASSSVAQVETAIAPVVASSSTSQSDIATGQPTTPATRIAPTPLLPTPPGLSKKIDD